MCTQVLNDETKAQAGKWCTQASLYGAEAKKLALLHEEHTAVLQQAEHTMQQQQV